MHEYALFLNDETLDVLLQSDPGHDPVTSRRLYKIMHYKGLAKLAMTLLPDTVEC